VRSYINLIHFPAQETLELPTQPPIADFDADFADKSVEELAEYYEKRWEIKFPGGKGGCKCDRQLFGAWREGCEG